jgi:hypothetical protein
MRKRRLYEPGDESPFRLSRTKVELYVDCQRCFYLDRRLGISRPRGYPLNLNLAVDHLLKVEFDSYRTQKKPHPYMVQAGIDAIPYAHPDLDTWRANFTGISFVHAETNFEVFGAVDDVWQESNGDLLVVDYKATSLSRPLSIDYEWQNGRRDCCPLPPS